MILDAWIVPPADCQSVSDAVTQVICDVPALREEERRVALAASRLARGLKPGSRLLLAASHIRWRSALHRQCPPGDISGKDTAVVRCFVDTLKERQVQLKGMERPVYGVRRFPLTDSGGSIEWEAVEGPAALATKLTTASRLVTPSRLAQGRYEVELNSTTEITGLPAGILEVRNTTLYADSGRAWVESYSQQSYVLANEAHILSFSEVFPVQHRVGLHGVVRQALVESLGEAGRCLGEVPPNAISARIGNFANYRFIPGKGVEIEFKFPGGCPNPVVEIPAAALSRLMSVSGRRHFGF